MSIRLYAHDYVWGVQHRRAIPGRTYGILDLYECVRKTLMRRKRASKRV